MVKRIGTQKPKVNKVWVAIVVLLLVQLATIGYIAKLHANDKAESTSSLARLINESESKRYVAPVISVSEERVYIPELRIFMPLTDISRHLKYSVSSNPGTTLYLSVANVVGNQKSTDDPSCDRMVRLSISKDTPTSEKYIGEIIPTKDGLRYIYQNINKCSIYSNEMSDKLVELVRSIQGY